LRQGVLYIIEKISKCRCQKWARMNHLDICSTSYDKMKGRESNWQFESRPLKVGNRPNPSVCRWSATHRWKALNKGYNFSLDLIAIGGLQRKLCALTIAKVPTVGISGLPFGSPRTKKPFGCGPCGELQSILYGGRWWFPPNPGCGESCESRVARGCPSTKGTPESDLTNWVVGLMQVQISN
jgi:hypothetical protein